MKNYHLIGLDVDRTLVKDSQGTDLNLELVKKLQTFSERTQVALITNQGGPACRDAGWTTSEKYPGFREVQTRMEQIATTLQQTIGRQVRLYICYAFLSKQGEILLPAALKDQLHRIDWTSWRLPGPGMLLQAQYDAGVKDPLRCLFVGDEEKSQQAAKAARWDFFRGRNFVIADPKWVELAQQRVQEILELHPYRQILIGTDWGEVQQWEWVARAELRDILDWCEKVESSRNF